MHIFKGRFKSNSLSLYGIFLIIFNKNGDVDSYNTVVSTFSNVYELEPHSSWEKYEEMILDLKWRGNNNVSMTSSLMDQLSKFAKEDNLQSQLFSYINDYDYTNAEGMLYDFVNRIIHDKNLILETTIQEITPEEFHETKDQRGKFQETRGTARSLEDGAVILPIEPVLAPVKGKPIYELKVGDKIMAKIIASSDRANYFIDLLDLREGKSVKSLPCEVIDIKSSGRNTPIEILTQIGPGIYGKCDEEEKQVKLRVYDPITDGPINKSKIDPKKIAEKSDRESTPAGAGFSRGTYLVIALFAVLLMIFILLIYISIF